jgi:hypothetical protein
VTLISGTRKSKTKIKWTTKITTRPKGIKTNSSPTTIRRTSQKEKKKAVRLRRVSARRASEKKMVMNRVKKKAQSISTMKQAPNRMRSSMNHLKRKARVGKSLRITNQWLRAQSPKLIVNLKTMASSNRKTGKVIRQKMKMV